MTLIEGFKIVFGYKIETELAHLQRFIYGFSLSDEEVSKSYGLSVRYIDYDSDQDLQLWCDVINNSYDDCFFDVPKARNFLNNHILFGKGKTVMFMDNITPCATVSWGGYKRNPKVGGDYRIGVRNDYKGNGIGRMCVEYAYSRLAEQGFRIGESVIEIKRTPSLLMHFSLGFEPQYDMRYVTFRSPKNIKYYIKFIQRMRVKYFLHKYNKQYKNKLKKSFQ